MSVFVNGFVLALFGEPCVVLCGWWFFFLGDDEIWVVVFKVVL